MPSFCNVTNMGDKRHITRGVSAYVCVCVEISCREGQLNGGCIEGYCSIQ